MPDTIIIIIIIIIIEHLCLCGRFCLSKRGFKLVKIEYRQLLYLFDSMCAVIGQFSGPYSPVRPAKICNLSPSLLKFYSK